MMFSGDELLRALAAVEAHLGRDSCAAAQLARSLLLLFAVSDTAFDACSRHIEGHA
jgi:hypothetical protein